MRDYLNHSSNWTERFGGGGKRVEGGGEEEGLETHMICTRIIFDEGSGCN